MSCTFDLHLINDFSLLYLLGKRSITDDFFTEDEFWQQFNFRSDLLPTKTDCLLFVVSRTHNKTKEQMKHSYVVHQMATIVENIWSKADCCPFSKKYIMKLFDQNIWKPYLYLRRQRHLSSSVPVGQKRSHKKDPSKVKVITEPVRKSSRGNMINVDAIWPVDRMENESSSESVPRFVKQITTNTRSTISLRKIWDTEEGVKLLDVKSSAHVKKCSKDGFSFDQTFYIDQKTSRSLRMLVTKVTKEFAEAEKARMKKEAVAMGETSILSNEDLQSLIDDEEEGAEEDKDDNWNESMTIANELSSMHTRHTRQIEMRHELTQTDDHPQTVPVRLKSVRGEKWSSLIEPRYLEAMALLMSDNLSASEAVKAVYTIDTVIWGQVRHLSLRLDKSYMNAFTALKKMQSNNEIIDNSIHNNEDFLNHHVTAIGCNEKTVEVNPQIVKLKKIVKEKFAERKSDAENTLPDPVCVRSNHKLVSVFCEKRVAEEMVEKEAFILPDGTSRQGVGDIAGVVVKVGDKIRALKGLKISKGDRKNWATTIAHMLDRLATASNVEVDDI